MNWEALTKEYEQLTNQLAATALDKNARGQMQKRVSQIANLLEKHDQQLQLIALCDELALQSVKDPELAELYQEEIVSYKEKLLELEKDFSLLLHPADEMNERSVFLEIRAGAGGQEAALFASDLYKMYSNYALSKKWHVAIVAASDTDLGGFKELIMHITGKDVYKHLKFESGVHRVQRVPNTETQGRVHTSTVTVAVLPEAEDVDITVNMNDLRIDTFRASGAGGQHVNTTDSAVRITHIPTGLVVSCQDERSQTKNKAQALKVLQSRLLEAEKERKEAELSVQRKSQIGTGMRSEKIRTYNYPQNRITDHRIELTLKKLDIIMQGVIDDLIDPLMAWEHEQRKHYSPFAEFM